MKLRVIVTGVLAFLGSTTGVKAITLLLIAVATRELGLEAVGRVFFVEAAAAIALRALDLGFYEVIARRTARGETSRRTVARTLGIRVGGLALVASLASGVAHYVDAANAPVVTGFFVVFGLFSLHEIGRAVLAGKERFAENATIAVMSRGLGAGIAIGGLVSGHGIRAWLVGLGVAESLQLVWVTALAWRILPPADPARPERPLVPEGIPFWMLALLGVSVAQGSALIVGGSVGMTANGVFGVSNKVVQGALLGVTGLTYAAYPALARDRRRSIEPRHAAVVLVVSGLVALLVAAGAPILAPLLGDADAARAVTVTRWLTPAAFVLALGHSLGTWLRAKDGERGLVVVALLEAVLMLGSMALLVPRYGLPGAVVAVTLGALVRLAGTSALAFLHARGPSDGNANR